MSKTIHLKVQCWLFTQKKIHTQCLLLQTTDKRGAFWQPVTGSVESEENLFEAAKREIIEETGFKIDRMPISSGYTFEYLSRFGPTQESTFCYLLDHIDDPLLDPNEHQSFQWLHPKQALPILKFPTNVEGLKKSYALLFKEDLL